MTTYRLPKGARWPADAVNSIVESDAAAALRGLPDSCVALAITSPPYWDIVDYQAEGQIGVGQTYEAYLADLLAVWRETERVLIPNGKLAIVTPVMPIRKDVIGDQHTRHLKNIGSDIEHTILDALDLKRFGLFIWQKQTTTKMFGSYPYPPNIYEDNTIEFIHVFVKDGAPPSPPDGAKEASKITQEEWRNLTMQVWNMYPADVKRAQHPAPFPVVLPQRLIRMYTFATNPDTGFAGDLVLDPFAGSGSTCVAARALGRNWIGIDLNPEYCRIARDRARYERVNSTEMMLEWPRVRRPTDSAAIQVGMFDEPENGQPTFELVAEEGGDHV
ncbi:MAG: site-specific DNA-methyltransferase [Chloroflexi bacterium]|nr:site-specific DNA-methyltransferase [Chloroflexota bacterium]